MHNHIPTMITHIFWNQQRIKGEIEEKGGTSVELNRKVAVERFEWTGISHLETLPPEQIKVADYDKEQLEWLLQQQMVGTGIALLLHTIGGYTTPLVIAAVIQYLLTI